MALILALEPDHRQATLLGNLIRGEVRAELQIVDSRDAAIAAISARIPDVILLSSLLSPRDEEDLLRHIRLLEGTEHVQTHNIPIMAAAGRAEPSSGSGLFGRLRRKPKQQEVFAACDPAVFAEEISSYVVRAKEAKIEAAARAHALVPLTAQPPAVETPHSPVDAFTWKPRHGEPEPTAPARQVDESPREQLRLEETERERLKLQAGETERERLRLEAEARERERLRLEAEEAERVRLADEARIRAEEEARRQAEEEARRQEEEVHRLEEARQRREAEEAKAREREAEAAAARAREEERLRGEEAQRQRELEAAAERQRQLLEAEAAAQREHKEARRRFEEEQRRRETEEAAERERLVHEAEAQAERAREAELERLEQERLRLEEAEAAEHAKLRKEAEAASELARQAERGREEAEQRRLAAQQAAERELREKEEAAAAAPARKARPKPQPSDDPFSDFRAVVTGSGADSVFTLMPIASWARPERPRPAESAQEQDEAFALLARLRLPVHVSGFAYPQGCRIRRVRVPALPGGQPRNTGRPVIVSRRTLEELRTPR